MADLLKLIKTVSSSLVPFCMVCFRTENERKLVRPDAIKQFCEITAAWKSAISVSIVFRIYDIMRRVDLKLLDKQHSRWTLRRFTIELD